MLMSDKTYTIPPQALAEISARLRKQVRILSWALPLAALVVVIVLGVFRVMSFKILFILYPLFLVVLIVWLSIYLRVQEESWATVNFTLSVDGITRAEAGRRKITVRRDKIVAIHDLPDGPLVIQYRQGSRQRSVAVPTQLDGFEEIRAQVLTWIPEEAT